MNYKNDVEAIDAFVVKYNELNKEIAKVIVGQNDTVKNVLISNSYICANLVRSILEVGSLLKTIK